MNDDTPVSGRTASGNRPSFGADGADEIMRALQARTGRTCGQCSMCCKVPEIDQEELRKPANEWCKHCHPGVGCVIYDSRPPVCRTFGCEWLLDNINLGDEWKPSLSKIVAYRTIAENLAKDVGRKTSVVYKFIVDPAFPNRWREAPFYRDIKYAARAGLTGVNGEHFETQVGVGKRFWVILPDEDVEFTGYPVHVTMPVGENKWRVLKFKSLAEGQKRLSFLSLLLQLAAKEG